MENEHELSYETLTRVYLGSYEHYKSVEAEVEYLEPGFELQGAKMVEMGRFGIACLYGLDNESGGLRNEVKYSCSWRSTSAACDPVLTLPWVLRWYLRQLASCRIHPIYPLWTSGGYSRRTLPRPSPRDCRSKKCTGSLGDGGRCGTRGISMPPCVCVNRWRDVSRWWLVVGDGKAAVTTSEDKWPEWEAILCGLDLGWRPDDGSIGDGSGGWVMNVLDGAVPPRARHSPCRRVVIVDSLVSGMASKVF
ncbi:hypothetical protein Tco_1378059 [Tanacetum coccineum]